MTLRPPLRYAPDPVLLGEYDAGGTAGAQTVAFSVLGFDPRVSVAVAVFFQPKAGTTTVPSSGNTWSLAPTLKDTLGEERPLQNIFSSRPLPDGWELITRSHGVRGTCSLSIAGSEQGKWIAKVIASPVWDLHPEELDEIYRGIKLIGPTSPLRLAP